MLQLYRSKTIAAFSFFLSLLFLEQRVIAQAPSITADPVSASACIGSTVSFSVTASNATGYQWQVNTGSGFTNITNTGVYTGATTSTLLLTAVPLSMNGYAYQVVVTGASAPNATSAVVTLSVSSTNTWVGGTSSGWNTAANWSCGIVPLATHNVVIPSGTTFSPQVNSTTAIANNITINSGAALSFTAGSNVLEVKGNFTNSGTFTANSGKLKLSGTSTQTVPAATYKDFELAGSGTKTASGAINISGVLTLTNGFLQMGTSSLTLGNAASIAGANAVLLNPAPTSYIITNSTGEMRIQNIGTGGKTGAVLFPIGTSSSSYTPVTIQNAGTVDVFGARVINGVYRNYNTSNVPTGAVQNTYNVGKTWAVTEGTAGGSNATINFAFSSFDEQPGFNDGACFAARFQTGTGWLPQLPAQTANGFDPYSLAMTGLTQFGPFAVGSQFSILPLKLTSFTGNASSAGNSLNWTTTDETDVDAFHIERSYDGVNFNAIASIKARNLVGDQQYQYVDAGANTGATYYRLKMVDIDGSFTYSAIVYLVTNRSGAAGYTVYPNPVINNKLSIRNSRTVNEEVTVSATDLNGRTIQVVSFPAAVINSGTAVMDVSTLSKGIYVLKITESRTGVTSAVQFQKQ